MTLGLPKVDKGHFGQSDLKWHFECFDARMGCNTSIEVFPRPHGEKIMFLVFSGSGMQIDGGQNTVSTIVINHVDFGELIYE